MASGTSSLDSNESSESIPHSYVSAEHHTKPQLPHSYVGGDHQHKAQMSHSYSAGEHHKPQIPPIPLDYDVLSANQCYDKTYSAGHLGMSGAYEYELGAAGNDTLKQQCDKALHDLNLLRRQHSETSRRCEHAMKELEYFRGQHRAAMSQLDASAQEASTLRGKYSDLLNDNQRLELQVQHLQVGGSPEEFHGFQKRYEDLISEHTATLEQLRALQEENSRLKVQCHDLTQDRNAVIRERSALKQQVASLVRQWETGARVSPPDIKRLTDERNAALHEYTLIMSERDTVHKEMEKLSDDLQSALKRSAALEAALQAAREEQRATALQAESLRREIASALQDRDRALKECSDLKAPHHTATLGKSRQDNSAYHHLGLASGAKDGCVNGQHPADGALDKLQGACAGPAETLEQAQAQLERLRKHCRRLQADLLELTQEAEVSKRRRDWAFSERDKIVQERESIRTLCDRLRKERDRAVSDLAEALRDSDDIKKQRNLASKQLKELRDRLDAELDAERGADAADSDDQLEWETLDLELAPGRAALQLAARGDALCVLRVPRDAPHLAKLRPNDRILSIAGARHGTARAALAALSRALETRACSVRVRRACGRVLRVRPDTVQLQAGIFISKIMNPSKEDVVCVGERVIRINNRSTEGMTCSHCNLLLGEGQCCTLTVALRPSEGPRLAAPAQHPAGKMVNSCSQTDEPWCHLHAPRDTKPEQSVVASELDRRYVYHVAAGSQGKIHQERGTWDMIRGKIEAVTGRSKSKDKQNKVPETDAIAELDSVIDSYHGKSSKEPGGVLKRSRRKKADADGDAKNGGTWPKARAAPGLQDRPTGTIVQGRARRQRPPLSVLLSPPTKLQPEPHHRNSNPIPLAHQPPAHAALAAAPARHSVYKTLEAAPDAHFPKPAPLSVHTPYPQPYDKDKLASAEYADDVPANRLSLALDPSDDSLEYRPLAKGRNKSPHSLDFAANKGPSSLDFVARKSPASLQRPAEPPAKDALEQYYSKKSSPKTATKYGSDSDSLGPDGLAGTLPAQSRLHAQYYRGPFTNAAPHAARYHPPPDTPQSRSGESIGDMPAYAHAHNMSDLQPRTPRALADYQPVYEGGTFPRKKENARFRIPSNPSVTSKNSAGKLSTGSIERSSERNSPMPTFHVEVLSPGRGAEQLAKGARNSMPEYCGLGWSKPLPGELRRVHIDKSQQPLGIQISCPPGSGGVFVSTVGDNSLASQVGLQVGDQLLEVCGINMRSATYTLAANVLRQCGNSITMLVQYSPDKYQYEIDGSGSSSSGSSSHDEEASVSGSPTPRNSPGPQQLRLEPAAGDGPAAPRPPPPGTELPRFLLVEMRNCSDLGISLVGGNAVGVFVHSVQIDSAACAAGLRTGDHILEYNGVDLRHATAEQAALELAKPADKVSVLVRHDLAQYHEVKDKPGDALYIRAGFDRCARITAAGLDTVDSYSLWFNKDEVLFVDNTLFNGAPGLWRAWTLDAQGNKQHWGTIPSKFKVEEMLRRSLSSLDEPRRAGSAASSARRSFFRRKKQRARPLATYSQCDDAELTPPPYLRVERLHYGRHRPLVLLGAMRDCLCAKLLADWGGAFAALQHGLDVRELREKADKGVHVILDVSVATVETLHKRQIYPIVLLVKFKSTKQIKEVKDARFPADKVSAKAAKEMYEHALRLEEDFKNYISAVIPAGGNIAYMCTQIKAAVDEEQNKTLWVPSVQA